MSRFLGRLVVVLLVLLVLVGLALFLAERLVGEQVDAQVQVQVEQALTALTDDGAGFATVTTDVGGSALLGLARRDLETVEVRATDGTVGGVPVRSIEATAEGLALDGTTARSLDVRVVADATAPVAALAAPAVVARTTAAAEDLLEVALEVKVPLLPPLDVVVQVSVSVQDGALVLEPVNVAAVGLDLDASALGGVLPSRRVEAGQVPLGLRLDSVLVSGGSAPVLELTASCAGGCPLDTTTLP